MRGAAREPDSEDAAGIEAAVGEIVRSFRYTAVAGPSGPADAHIAGWRLPGSHRKCTRVRQSWKRKNASLTSRRPRTNPQRPPHPLYQLRDACPGTAHCQARSQTEQVDQEVRPL